MGKVDVEAASRESVSAADDPTSVGGETPVTPDGGAVTELLDGPVIDPSDRLLQHVLLSTDGTVVRLLEGCFGETIRLAEHVQTVRPAAPTDPPELEVSEGENVLHRRVLLQGSRSGRNYVAADSLIAVDRVSPPVREALLSTSLPIGRILAEHRVESFREMLRVGRTRSPRAGIDAGGDLLSRTYRIVIGGRPAMLITEEFSASSLSLDRGSARDDRRHAAPPSAATPASSPRRPGG